MGKWCLTILLSGFVLGVPVAIAGILLDMPRGWRFGVFVFVVIVAEHVAMKVSVNG